MTMLLNGARCKQDCPWFVFFLSMGWAVCWACMILMYRWRSKLQKGGWVIWLNRNVRATGPVKVMVQTLFCGVATWSLPFSIPNCMQTVALRWLTVPISSTFQASGIPKRSLTSYWSLISIGHGLFKTIMEIMALWAIWGQNSNPMPGSSRIL